MDANERARLWALVSDLELAEASDQRDHHVIEMTAMLTEVDRLQSEIERSEGERFRVANVIATHQRERDINRATNVETQRERDVALAYVELLQGVNNELAANNQVALATEKSKTAAAALIARTRLVNDIVTRQNHTENGTLLTRGGTRDVSRIEALLALACA